MRLNELICSFVEYLYVLFNFQILNVLRVRRVMKKVLKEALLWMIKQVLHLLLYTALGRLSCIYSQSFFCNRMTDSLLAPSDDCSILAGGKRTGWYSDVAVALWRRLLGILGDVNTVIDPVIHQLIFTYLLKIWKVLYKVSTVSING